MPLSPVQGPKRRFLFYKVHKNEEACSAYLYSKSQEGKRSEKNGAFCRETGSLEGTGADILCPSTYCSSTTPGNQYVIFIFYINM